jgi:recombination protein RecA
MGNVQAIIDGLAKQGLMANRLSDDDSPCVVNAWLSTGCCVLDAIMGGGLPVGRIVELYGATSSGKSLVASQACTACQEEDGVAVYFDTEAAVSLPIMEAVGVDVNSLVYAAPDTVEEVFKGMESAIASKPAQVPMLIVWDSIASTSSEAEMKGETGEIGYLTQSRVISQGLRKLSRMIAKQHVSVLMINQMKEKLGVVFGDKDATFGGKAVGFHSSIRIRLSSGSKIRDSSKRILGISTTASIRKNKVAPPFREAALPIYFGYGVDEAEAALAFLKKAGVAKYAKGKYTVRLPNGDIQCTGAQWADVFDDEFEWCVEAVYKAASMHDLV